MPRDTGLPRADAESDFSRARRQRALARLAARLRRADDVNHILPFEEVVQALGRVGERRLGEQLIQLDSVNVAVRAHYMPVFSRIGPYDTGLLTRAAEQRPRRLVEYWAHVQALMPVELWPVMQHRMDSYRAQRGKWWQSVDDDLADRLLAEISARGPSTCQPPSLGARSRSAGICTSTRTLTLPGLGPFTVLLLGWVVADFGGQDEGAAVLHEEAEVPHGREPDPEGSPGVDGRPKGHLHRVGDHGVGEARAGAPQHQVDLHVHQARYED